MTRDRSSNCNPAQTEWLVLDNHFSLPTAQGRRRACSNPATRREGHSNSSRHPLKTERTNAHPPGRDHPPTHQTPLRLAFLCLQNRPATKRDRTLEGCIHEPKLSKPEYTILLSKYDVNFMQCIHSFRAQSSKHDTIPAIKNIPVQSRLGRTPTRSFPFLSQNTHTRSFLCDHSFDKITLSPTDSITKTTTTTVAVTDLAGFDRIATVRHKSAETDARLRLLQRARRHT